MPKKVLLWDALVCDPSVFMPFRDLGSGSAGDAFLSVCLQTLATCMTTPLVPTQANLQLTFSQTGVNGALSVSGVAFGSAGSLLIQTIAMN